MPSQGELMRASLPAEAARLLGATLNSTPQTATGSVQGDALVLTANITNFTTVAASTGCILPSATGVAPYMVTNNGANALSVYPAVGEMINGGSANAAFSVTNAKAASFYPHGNTWIVILSA